MKFKTILVMASMLFLTACNTRVPAGNVGVKFDLYGGDKGVTGEVVGPGKYWLGWNEEMYLFPTFTVNDSYIQKEGNDIVFQDKDGTQISADIGIAFSIPADKADEVFQKYRKGVNELVDVVLKNSIRNALNSETAKMEVSEIYGLGKEDLLKRTLTRVQAEMQPVGVNLENVFWIGAMRLPDNITSAINQKIEATQRAQQAENELQRTIAEAEKLKVKSKADAEANAILAKSITTDVLKMRQLDIQEQALQKWDGRLPTTMIPDSSLPFIGSK